MQKLPASKSAIEAPNSPFVWIFKGNDADAIKLTSFPVDRRGGTGSVEAPYRRSRVEVSTRPGCKFSTRSIRIEPWGCGLTRIFSWNINTTDGNSTLSSSGLEPEIFVSPGFFVWQGDCIVKKLERRTHN
jgi:hypothetical protein